MRVLLPLAIVLALVLVSQGVVQTLSGAAAGDDGRRRDPDDLPAAPIASQEAIKELGTNGGGIANANSAHPFENPTAFTNLRRDVGAARHPVRAHVRVRAHGRRPAPGLGGVRSDVRALDRIGGRSRSGFEIAGNPLVEAEGASSALGNMEGKEVRFGAATSGLFAASTTGTSTGAVNAAHDCFTPLGGAVPLVEHDAGRGVPRRRRRRPLRHADLRAARGLHRGAHGRADARVPRQEDPGGGDEARRPLPARRTDADPRVRVVLGPARRTRRPRSSTRARMASRRSSTPSPRRRTTTAPRSEA